MARTIDTTLKATIGIQQLTFFRQIGIIVGFAVSIALAVYVVLWANQPDFVPLYSDLAPKDSNLVIKELTQASINFKLDQRTGMVLVSPAKLHEAKIKLAEHGLPHSHMQGFEIMNKSKGFGSSQFVEMARYKHAQEGELARTIASMEPIQNARVHLAIPKQSGFLRDKQKPSASVLIDIFPGNNLSRNQIKSIVHLVASSIPGLAYDDVTVADNSGALLSSGKNDKYGLVGQQFDYIRGIENTLATRIINILTPIVGPGRVEATVSADLDFTESEETAEVFDPDNLAIRSEQSMQTSREGAFTSGVPGALSNQPGGKNTQAANQSHQSGQSQQESVKNYELDKKTSYTKHSAGKIKRLTVAVVVDDKVSFGDDGTENRSALSEAELANIKSLVKDTVGFNQKRGDTVSVINSTFAKFPEIAAQEELPIFEKAWFMPLVKQSLAGALILFILFMVIRPILKELAAKSKAVETMLPQNNNMNLALDGTASNIPTMLSPDESLQKIQQIVASDPSKAAQVVKHWVSEGQDDQ